MSGLRILVVDDHEDSAVSLAMLLQRRGHAVVTVGSGADALERFDAEPFDCVILDIGLPDTDGYALAKQLRERQGARSLRLYAASGYTDAEARRRALEAGCDEHFPKPVDAPRLLGLLAEASRG